MSYEKDFSSIAVDPDVLHGVPTFRGTRVPVSALIDNLAVRLTLDEFLENFPTVKREQTLQVLEISKQAIANLKLAA